MNTPKRIFVPKKKPQKNAVFRKTDIKLGFWVLCFIVAVITANFVHNEFRTKVQPVKVLYKKKAKK